MEAFKLLFIGASGAGKTTCITALSDKAPISTEVPSMDARSGEKKTITVALDYGEMALDDGARLLLYGLPGQARFRFMFEVVAQGLLGIVLLVDAAADDGVDGLRQTLQTYGPQLRQWPLVVALNKNPDVSAQFQQECLGVLAEHSLVVPVVAVDARMRVDIARLFKLMFTLLEHGFECRAHPARMS